MSEKFIPEHIDPYRFAEQGLHLEGMVKVIDMHRLSSLLSAGGEPIAVSLIFGLDEQGLAFVKGHLETKLLLQCQRCMEPYKYEIISDFLLGVVSSIDEADALPEHYEPAMAKEGQLALRELIEDELILNLPIIPKHEINECKVRLPLADAGWDEAKGKNPFDVLKTLKDKR